MTTTAVGAAVRVPVVREQFFARMSVACLMVGLLGFAPTYWMPLAQGSAQVSTLTHLHAALFFGWLLFSTSQAWLVASGRTLRHRDLGLVGISMATAMVFVGTALAIQGVLAQEAAGHGEASRRFAVIPFTGIAFFGLLFALAIANVRRPAIHKRLMLVATVSILQAAVGRVVLTIIGARVPGSPAAVPPPVAVSILPGLLADILLVVAMVHDRRTDGRVHKVYWVAGTALIALQVLRVPIAATDAWMRITYAVTALAR